MLSPLTPDQSARARGVLPTQMPLELRKVKAALDFRSNGRRFSVISTYSRKVSIEASNCTRTTRPNLMAESSRICLLLQTEKDRV